MRETKFKILYQGDVQMAHDVGYSVVGGNDAVCFYIDPYGRADVEGSMVSNDGCPIVFISGEGSEDSTEIEFTEFKGWRFHASAGGKSIAIALVRCAEDDETIASVTL